MSSAPDFRFKEGDNQGVVSVFIYVSHVGPKADHSITYSEKPSKAIRFISLEIIMLKLRGNLTSSWQIIQKI